MRLWAAYMGGLCIFCTQSAISGQLYLQAVSHAQIDLSIITQMIVVAAVAHLMLQQ